MQSQHGSTGPAGAKTRRIELGWQVYDALERPVGNVADVEQDRGQLRIDGRPAGFTFYEVPLSAVREVKQEDVYLSLQLDATTASGDSMPRWTNGAAVPRASSTPRDAASTPRDAAATARWSSTIEHPNIVKVGEGQSRDVPVWTEDERSASSYLPWLAALGVGAAGAAGYYYWRKRQRRSTFQRALDLAGDAFGFAGDSFEPVYERAKERPAWALALTTAAALPLAAYLRSSLQEESTVDATRSRLKEYSPFTSRSDMRDTAAAWWESAPSVRDSAASVRDGAVSLWESAPALGDALPSFARQRSTLRDYLTQEEDSDWLTWPLVGVALGMVVGAIWYLFKQRSGEGETTETIHDIMTPRPEVLRPDSTVFDAAALMRRLDVGAVPVCDGARLQGMLTDRDIAVRSAADGRDPHLTLVRDIMTNDVTWAYEDESVERAADLMREHQIRRLPIVSRDKRLVGIVSLGDLAVDTGDDRLSGSTLEEISEPARPSN